MISMGMRNDIVIALGGGVFARMPLSGNFRTCYIFTLPRTEEKKRSKEHHYLTETSARKKDNTSIRSG